VCFLLACNVFFRVGLSVKERKWGKSGYIKDIVHVNYETTPTKPDASMDHTDSGGREERGSGHDHGFERSSGDGVAMVRSKLTVRLDLQ